MEDKSDTQTTPATTPDAISTARTRGRPRRPTAQKSVHQLVLNLTQSSEKKTQNVNKKQKTNENEIISTTETTTELTTKDVIKDTIKETPKETTTAPTTTTTDAVNDWKVGQKVEARDTVGDWYSAKIVSVNSDKSEVLVHFERWSSRYDQWFPKDSTLIRQKSPKETNSTNNSPEFTLHEEVLARWTDNRPYPATIVEVYAQQRAVLVLFFDGYRKKVKFNQIEKMPKNFSGLRVPALKTAFEIKADHNEYKCHFDDCGKGFRKQRSVVSLFNSFLNCFNFQSFDATLKTLSQNRRQEDDRRRSGSRYNSDSDDTNHSKADSSHTCRQ